MEYYIIKIYQWYTMVINVYCNDIKKVILDGGSIMRMDYAVIDGDLLINIDCVGYKKEEYMRSIIEKCLAYFVLICKSMFAEEIIKKSDKIEAKISSPKGKSALADKFIATCKRVMSNLKKFLQDESAAELKLHNAYNKVRQSHPILVPLVITIVLSIVCTLIYEICFEKKALSEITDFENVLIENREDGQQITIIIDEDGHFDIIDNN